MNRYYAKAAKQQTVPVDHQPLPVDHQPLPVDYQPLPVDHQPLPVDHQPLPVDQPSASRGRGLRQQAVSVDQPGLWCRATS